MITTRDIRIVNKLALLCLENKINLRCRHVAAVADKNRIISIAFNQEKTDPWFYKVSKSQTKQFGHSEQQCLKNLKMDLRRCTLYSVRVDRSNELAQAKPCHICEQIIKKSGIKRVVHTIYMGLQEDRYA